MERKGFRVNGRGTCIELPSFFLSIARTEIVEKRQKLPSG